MAFGKTQKIQTIKRNKISASVRQIILTVYKNIIKSKRFNINK
jgi:hypothetical protein